MMNAEINQEALDELKRQLTPLNAVKIILGTLVSFGATAAVIAAFRDPIRGAKGVLKLIMASGVFVLGCKAGDIADNYLKESVDNLAETVSSISNEVKKLEGADTDNGTDTGSGRNTQQQPEKQTSGRPAEGTGKSGKTTGTSIWGRWWGQKKGTEQVLEMDEKDVPERQKPEGNSEGNHRKPGSAGS